MAKVTKSTAKKSSTKKAAKKATTAAKPVKKVTKKAAGAVKKAAAVPAPSVEKQKIIKEFQVNTGDTGSPEVQIALLTSRIDKLVSHLKGNPTDNHSRRGLLGIVSKRRRLMNYLEKRDQVRYKEVLGKLGLSK
jgi:small subunit ribosomal protein S15